MPALPVIAGIFRVAFLYQSSGGQHAVNVMHFSSATGDAADVWSAIETNWDRDLIRAVEESVTIIRLDITPLDGATATQSFSTGSGAIWTGEACPELLPAVAAMVKLTTGLRGRSKRGRVFLPFVGESVAAAGFLATGTQGLMQAKWSTFITDMGISGVPLHVASYKNATSERVISANVEQAFGTQRRRQSRLR
jgi:hypothetical protein